MNIHPSTTIAVMRLAKEEILACHDSLDTVLVPRHTDDGALLSISQRVSFLAEAHAEVVGRIGQ